MQAKVVIWIIGIFEIFRESLHKGFRRRVHIGVFRKDRREESEKAKLVVFGKIRIVFDRIRNAQIQVSEKHRLAQVSRKAVDIQRKSTRHEQKHLVGILERVLDFCRVKLAHKQIFPFPRRFPF